METEYFITEYLNGANLTPMICVLKHLFSDFIVKEISSDGTVCDVCTSIPDVAEMGDFGGKTDPDSIDTNCPIPSGITNEDLIALDELLSDEKKVFTLSVKGCSKEQRTEIHLWIRSRYKGKLESKTDDSVISVSGSFSSRKRKHWPKDLPDYLHLTMSKCNKESYAALSLLAKFLGANIKNIGLRGIKDRRAVTAQRISIYHYSAKKALQVNSRLHGVRLSDYKYEEKPCLLGDLWGNQFNIVLRNVSVSDEIVKGRMDSFLKNGFINYFGTQRFGSYGVNTASIGRAIFKREWEKAVNLILCPRNSNDSLEDALKTWRDTGDAKLAFAKIQGTQAFTSIEARILKGLMRGSFKSALISLPRNTRSLYIHAFQSLLWNQIVSKRIKECGCKVLEGDIDIAGNELSAHADITKVALPLPSAKMQFPNNIVREWYKEILRKNEVDIEVFAAIGKEYSVNEVLRPMVLKPKDLEYKVVHYSNPDVQLQPSLDEVPQTIEESDDGTYKAVLINFSLPAGAFATVALREITRCDMGKASQKAMSEE